MKITPIVKLDIKEQYRIETDELFSIFYVYFHDEIKRVVFKHPMTCDQIAAGLREMASELEKG